MSGKVVAYSLVRYCECTLRIEADWKKLHYPLHIGKGTAVVTELGRLLLRLINLCISAFFSFLFKRYSFFPLNGSRKPQTKPNARFKFSVCMCFLFTCIVSKGEHDKAEHVELNTIRDKRKEVDLNIGPDAHLEEDLSDTPLEVDETAQWRRLEVC